jgi:transcriptional regulator with XRE-family HTH domain
VEGTDFVDAADLLKAARTRAGLRQSDVAARAGTSQPVISAYEQGEREPTLPTLRKLASACGVDLLVGWRPYDLNNNRAVNDVERARRLVNVLLLADAIPKRRRRTESLSMPRLVSK